MSPRYTLFVGTKDWSSWSLRPYLALRHIGVPFMEEVIPLRKGTTNSDILKISPAGRVPVLKIEDDGKSVTIWDSLAICETLADRHPEARLWPDDSFVRALARAYAAEMHSGFPDLREQLSMDIVRKLPLPALRDATRAQIGRIIEAWQQCLGEYAGGFLFGQFSLADCMYAPVVSRFTNYGVEVPAEIRSYMERIIALPGMRDWAAASRVEVDAGLA